MTKPICHFYTTALCSKPRDALIYPQIITFFKFFCIFLTNYEKFMRKATGWDDFPKCPQFGTP